MTPRLTPAMVAALRCIHDDGNVEAFYADGGDARGPRGRNLDGALWFSAADKVTNALIKRGLCVSDGRLGAEWELTDTGRDALAAIDADARKDASK